MFESVVIAIAALFVLACIGVAMAITHGAYPVPDKPSDPVEYIDGT